jgi:drug/metabolite transporter (DMT)-like permease
MTKTKLVGFIIAFFGIIILIIPEKNLLSENSFNNLSSELMVIGGAILYSFAAVYGKKFKITDPLNASSGTILFSAIIMFLYLYFFENIDQAYVNNNNIFSVIFLGIFCTAIATIIYFQILQTSGATFVSIMNYLIPIWSIFFGVIFFSENIFWNYLVGLIIVIIGIQIFQNNNLLNKTEK